MGIHRVGGTVVVMEHFDPEEALRCIETYKVTTSQWVPTMFVRMLKLPEDVRAKYDVSSLRTIVHGAAPCPAHVKQAMLDWWGPVLTEYYAGTEGNGFVCTNSDWLEHKGTVGRPRWPGPHPRRGGQRAAPARGNDLLRGREQLRVPQRPGQDPRLP